MSLIIFFAGFSSIPLLAQSHKPAESFSPPAYKPLRFEEEYSYLKDPSKQVDHFDQIKYIPFNRPDRYLSVGGETRQRFESYRNELFGLVPSSNRGFNNAFLQRYMLHADLHWSEDTRFFIQSKSGFEDGRFAGSRPEIDQNDFDFHQAFADLKLLSSDNSSALIRVGRQEFTYGSGRLVDVREGPTNRLSFDAVKLIVKRDRSQIDAFWSRPVENRAGAFDDIPNPDRSLWGLYVVQPTSEEVLFDVYYLGAENQKAVYTNAAGAEWRQTIGTRFQLRGESGWDLNYEAIGQFGTIGGSDIGAWSVATATRHRWADLAWKPRLGLRADVASGDRSRNDGTLNTFSPLYPSGAYFNLADPIGPSNIYDIHPVLDLTLTEQWTVTADWDFFWRQSLQDGAYTLSGRPIPQSATSNERFIGHSPALTSVYTPTRHLTLLLSYVHFAPGAFIRNTTLGKDVDYITFWGTYKF